MATASTPCDLTQTSLCYSVEVCLFLLCCASLIAFSDNCGLIILWDMALREPFQKIDASGAGSVTAVCWINLWKNSVPGEEDPAPAFAVGFGTGTIAIYKQTPGNVSSSAIFRT